MRVQIGLFGRTNVGKSSFLNMIAGQDIAVTSPIPGTTTDVVEKAMELLPFGPVVFLDTGGIDDISELSEARLKKTRRIFDRADVFVLITEPHTWGSYEETIVAESASRDIPVITVINKVDVHVPSSGFLEKVKGISPRLICCSSIDRSRRDRQVNEFKQQLLSVFPGGHLHSAELIGDLVPRGGVVVLIVPIDLEAPKGRLILPQVQTIRDVLDNDAVVVVMKEIEYVRGLSLLKNKPDLVVCDSQVVRRMAEETPADVPFTTFSVLFARFKGDLEELARGAAVIERLHDGDRVLIAEACSHHALIDDIGRVKIPRWLHEHTGARLEINVCSGRDYPVDLDACRLIIHCGSCMLTRREMLMRIRRAQEAGTPITNYGIAISALCGLAPRVLSPFPRALDAYMSALGSSTAGREK